MKTILLVDDQATERRLLYHALKSDYRILEAEDGESALRHLSREEVDLVILDLHLPPDTSTSREGVRLQWKIAECNATTPVVITTGDGDHSLALEMVRRGVADFLLKPIDPEVLRIVAARALERARLEREVARLRREMRRRYSFGNLVGDSPAMRAVFAKLERLAAASTTVLLLGDSGTGKSALARALHNHGPRAEKPFVVVDGASVPETLMESELFGHVRGAFTGAESEKPGRIQKADGGTLFLDEIGNLSPAAQARLLLFLDSRKFTKVGASEEIEVDVRLIAATNAGLDSLVEEGKFREDLLFRLQVATVTLPPLRERKQDIPLLAERFLAEFCREMKRPPVGLKPAALGLLESYPWPGNVRQLRHVLETSLVLADVPTLDAADLSLPTSAVTEAHAGSGSLKERVAGFERNLVQEALEKTAGNKAAAARLLGLDDNQIRYLCRKHGIG
jgi:DNA-binding NtrC family response regulator